MRYIDIELIRNKAKKIKLSDVNKKHLEDILFTDEKTGEKYLSWEDIEAKHLSIIKELDSEERKKYISSHSDWNILQKIMIEEFGYKCWYSEAPIGNGEFEIDHYRPKNRARQDDEKGIVNKPNGYWWLAYNLDNYRLSGTLANIRRRDRLKDNSEVGGKGDLFPLDLNEGVIATDEGSIFNERPLLLDPIVASDVGLLSFDEDGSVFPNPVIDDEIDSRRAEISIKLYHLDLDQLETQRQQVWQECSRVIEKAYLFYSNSNSREARKLAFSNCVETISKKTNLKAEFSSVAKVCLNLYKKRRGYSEVLDLLNL